MSEFKFLCPECGQKILGDTAYGGASIVCPTCQKTITIPAAASVAPPRVAFVNPPPLPAPTPPRASPSPSSRLSGLAAASLICSLWVPLGCLPGIICGHLAKARMRRTVFLEGEKLADAGLLISYCVLLAMLVVAGMFPLEHWLSTPVMRPSPAAIAASQPGVVDDVIIGQNEDDHDVAGQMQFMTENNGAPYRNATRGGSFSYTMKVLPNQAMTLNCRFWGGEGYGHMFDIAVEDQIIATPNLAALAPGHFVDVEYKIPASLTRGKSEVKVEFQGRPGMTAGPLYGCQMLQR